MLLKTSFLLPYLFCNVEFELIQLISLHLDLLDADIPSKHFACLQDDLIPLVSCMSKTEFPLGLIKFRMVTLDLLIDLLFLILSLSLLHSKVLQNTNNQARASPSSLMTFVQSYLTRILLRF